MTNAIVSNKFFNTDITVDQNLDPCQASLLLLKSATPIVERLSRKLCFNHLIEYVVNGFRLRTI